MKFRCTLFFMLLLTFSLNAKEQESFVTQDNTFTSNNLTFSFNCVCASVLTSAFKNFNNHLFDKNLIPLENKLNRLVEAIEESNKELDTEKENLTKELNQLKLLLLETDNYIFELEKDLKKSELK